MRTIELTYPHTLLREDLPETIGAIGFFDGIHQGHQKVIQTAVERAKLSNKESAVITFHPHPSVVLQQGERQVRYITPLAEKQKLFQALEVDRLYIITFNKELSLLSPQSFIDHFIVGLYIKHLIAGFDFTYGHKGKGNMKEIEKYANGAFTSEIINKVEINEEKVSSTKIRKLLENGEMERVTELLGRPLKLRGVVVEGERRGRTIGFPTANLLINKDALLPKIGVYAVEVIYKNNRYEAMANLGVKPTFHDDILEPTVEVYLFDYANDIYGEELVIQWKKFIREEQKFNGVDELVNQLVNDEKQIRSYFENIQQQNK